MLSVRADVLKADISNINFISHEAENEHEPKKLCMGKSCNIWLKVH